MITLNNKKVCIILPAYNEEKNIEACLQQTKEAFPDAFILVVDNNSTDRTAHLAKQMGVIVVTEYARGKGNAISTGVKMALARQCDWIAFHDSDGEYDAHDLARLVASCHEESIIGNLSLVMGVGLREVSLGTVLWRSLLANYVARLSLQLATKKKPPSDILTGARILSAALAKKIFVTPSAAHVYTGFELETGLTRDALVENVRVVTSPVRYVPRSKFEKKIKAWDMIHIVKAAWGF